MIDFRNNSSFSRGIFHRFSLHKFKGLLECILIAKSGIKTGLQKIQAKSNSDMDEVFTKH